MKKFLAIIAAAAMLAAAGCSSTTENTNTQATQEASSNEQVSGTVDMNGSTSMKKLVEALCETFNAENPTITAQGQFTGSGAGIEAVTAGTADIGNASRTLTDEEKAGGLIENIVAIDGIAVVVDKANTVTNLTMDQLKGIYTGQIRNWSEVGGQDGQIVVIGRESGSGTRSAFEELLEAEDQCQYAQELDQTGTVMTTVASTPNAIGYISLDVLNDTVNTVSLEGVEPTVENIKGGIYKLSRPFVMATKGEISEQSAAVQKFFEFIDSDEGQEIIANVGLISAK